MDGTEEIAFDFGTSGLWLYDANGSSKWKRLTPSNPVSMAAANWDGGYATELVVNFGSGGLWVYDTTPPTGYNKWTRISTSIVETD